MEFGFFSFLFLLSIFILLRTRKLNRNLPPGPRKLPVIGNLHHLISSDPPHRILKNLSDKFGPLMHLQLGQVDYLIVSSPETAELVMKTNDAVFSNRPSLVVTEIGLYGNTDIAFAPHGEYWRQLRRLSIQHMLGVKAVQSFKPIREDEALNLCKWIAAEAAKGSGSIVPLSQKLSETNLNIVTRAAIGGKRGEDAKVIDLLKEQEDLLAEFSVADLYPSIRLLRWFSSTKKMVERYRRITDEVFGKIILQRRLEGKNGEGDLLGALLEMESDETIDITLTEDNIKAVLMDLFGAGIDNSSTTIDWAMAEMMRKPSIMKKAQDEVRKVFDNKNKVVDENFLGELHYLKLVIKETFRLHPPVPLLIPRENNASCKIGNYEIPPKTRVLMNAWAIGRDPKYWDDAESFIPERFLEKTVDYKGSSFDFIPFGAGRRSCPGAGFAVVGIELQLAMFLYHFDWILPAGMMQEEMDMTEYFGVTTRRKNALNVIPVVRRPLPE